jgi:hypothetical protein
VLRLIFLFCIVFTNPIVTFGESTMFADHCTYIGGKLTSGDKCEKNGKSLSELEVNQAAACVSQGQGFQKQCPLDSCEAMCVPKGSDEDISGDAVVSNSNPSNTTQNNDDKNAKPTGGGTECDTAVSEVLSYCMAENDSGMNQVMQMAQVFSRNMGMASASDIATACSGMGSLSTMANGALATFKGVCLAKASSCQTACANNGAGLNKCNDASKKAKGLETDILLTMYTANNAKKCADLTTNPWQKLCQQNPTMAGCSTSQYNCSNPQFAATSVVCICQANPRDPKCGAVAGPPTDTPVDTNLASSTSHSPGTDLGLSPGGDGLNFNPGESPNGLPAGNSQQPGGGGYSNPGGGGNSMGKGSAAKAAGGGNQASNYNTKVNNGYYGAGGAPAMGGTNNSGNANNRNQYGSAGNTTGKIDLRQFLPGGKFDPRRGLAGISGPDGITGPSSDLFAKVNIRYRAVLPSLRP